MAALAKRQYIGKLFKNEEEVLRVRYDFSVDGGVVGALDIFEAQADLIITGFSAVVKTQATSGGAATLAAGVTGSTSVFMTATQGALANLTAGAAIFPAVVEGTPNVLATPRKLAAGEKVLQTIGTAALTAGVVEYTIKYISA